MAAIVSGARNVTPPSSARAALSAAWVEGGALALKVGPSCQATYNSPLGPTAGAELCCSTPLFPQLGLLGSVTKVWSGLTTDGPCQVFPASCVRQTSIWPKAVRGNFARLDEVRQRHQPGTAPVLGGRDRLVVVKVVRTGWRQEVDVVEGKAAAGEVAAVHAHSQVSPVRLANRQVGEVEGVADAAAPVQPRAPPGEYRRPPPTIVQPAPASPPMPPPHRP